MKIRAGFLLVVSSDNGRAGYFKKMPSNDTLHLTTDFTAVGYLTEEETDALAMAMHKVRKDEIALNNAKVHHVLRALKRIVEEQMGEVLAYNVYLELTKEGEKLGELHTVASTPERPTTYIAVVPFSAGVFRYIPEEYLRDLVEVPLLAFG